MIQTGNVLLGKYRIERTLGEGGMGVVALAHHIQLDQPVAIKFLRPEVLANQQVVMRFLREAQAAVKLKSEHVCKVHDVGTLENGAPYMVMEFMDGRELGALAGERGRLAPGEVVELVLQACEALAEAHALGIVHRDIKPSNLFVTRRPDGSALLKVLDFGISKAAAGTDLDAELTSTQAVMGTPAYMSPEQMRASKYVDARTDIWALGVVLYELLEGRRPFPGRAFSELCLQVGMDPTPPMGAALPPGLDAVVTRCLEKEPGHRFQNVAELAAALAPHARDPVRATTVVERATRVLGVAAIPLAAPAAQHRLATSPPGMPTTLSASVGQAAVEGPHPRRRWLIAGTAVSVLVAATLVLMFVGGSDANAPDGDASGAGRPATSVPAEASGEPGSAPGMLQTAEREPDTAQPDAGPVTSLTADAAVAEQAGAGKQDEAKQREAEAASSRDSDTRRSSRKERKSTSKKGSDLFDTRK